MSSRRINTPQGSDSSIPAEAQFRRLHPLGRIGLDGNACARANAGIARCQRCSQACPHRALRGEAPALELDPFACTECGLCVAQCPTLALTLEGFSTAAPPTAAGEPLRIACEPVARYLDPAAVAIRIPCLAGLALDDYLQLALTHPESRVEVVNGPCGTCSVVKSEAHPAWTVLADTRSALADMGIADQLLPQRIEPPRLPNGNIEPSAATRPQSGRRGFLTGLTRAMTGGLAPALRSTPATSRTTPQQAAHLAERTANRGERYRGLVELLAMRPALKPPKAALLPAVESIADCHGEGACARACPAAALSLEHDDQRATLRFDPWRCISCGACEQICAHQSLRSHQPAWRDYAPGSEVLASLPLGECRRCGAHVPWPAGNRPLCDSCSKSTQLAGAAFALLHQPRPVSPSADERPDRAAPQPTHPSSGPVNH